MLVNPVALDRFTQQAGRALDVPVVCVSLVDAHHRLLMGSYGMSAPLALLVSWSFVKQMGDSGHPLLIADGRRDPMAARSAAVRDGTVTAYMGMPLVASNGRVRGTLSVMDEKPRRWSAPQVDFLRELSARIVCAIEPGRGRAEHARHSQTNGEAGMECASP